MQFRFIRVSSRYTYGQIGLNPELETSLTQSVRDFINVSRYSYPTDVVVVIYIPPLLSRTGTVIHICIRNIIFYQ